MGILTLSSEAARVPTKIHDFGVLLVNILRLDEKDFFGRG